MRCKVENSKTQPATAESRSLNKIKVFCFKWITDIPNLPDWFEHEKSIEISPEQIIELFNSGNNIMLWHHYDKTKMLSVDVKKFSQR